MIESLINRYIPKKFQHLLNTGKVSAIEQAALSGLSLLINLLLVFGATKEIYGSFAVLNSYIILFIGIQNAVISIPMAVEFSPEKKEIRQSAMKSASITLLPLLSFFALLAAIILFFLDKKTNLLIPISFAIALIGSALREFTRTGMLIEQNLFRSLCTSFEYSFLSILFIAISYLIHGKLQLPDVFLSIGIAGILTSLPSILNLISFKNLLPLTSILSRLGKHTKWALPGVFVIWLQNNAYLTIIAQQFGAGSAGEIAAARLFITPYLTIFSGYMRPFSSKLSIALNNGDGINSFKIRNLCKKQFLISILMGSVFLIIALILKYLDIYKNLYTSLFIAVLWTIFAGISSARGVLTSLAHGKKEFRRLFLLGVASTVLTVILLLGAANTSMPTLSIVALSLGEASLLIMMYKIYKPEISNKSYGD